MGVIPLFGVDFVGEVGENSCIFLVSSMMRGNTYNIMWGFDRMNGRVRRRRYSDGRLMG